MKKKVAVGLSGGVDSAVAAAILKSRGFDVTGVFLYCFSTKNFPCSTDQDRQMAVKVADYLHIPLKIIDLRRQYRRSVVDYFFSEYRRGHTPNPDVMCNKEIKFGLFYNEVINNWKFDFVATGHYARIKSYKTYNSYNSYNLLKARDSSKDQSYFLYRLEQSQLGHILFPIGEYKKEQVRKMAKEIGLPNWNRPDSQGICFIGEVSIKKFLSTKLEIQKGDVLDCYGNVIGEHDGVWFYTIGQRHGFRISQNSKLKSQKYLGKPLYVLSKNSERNELIVGEKDECFDTEFKVDEFHRINQGISDLSYLGYLGHLSIRIRHLGEFYPCRIKMFQVPDPKCHVVLKQPAFAVAPGQSAVLYDGDLVLGGGIITA